MGKKVSGIARNETNMGATEVVVLRESVFLRMQFISLLLKWVLTASHVRMQYILLLLKWVPTASHVRMQ